MQKNEYNIKAYEIAYGKIKQMLFDLKIKPGEGLSELTLSKELGISRTPIREAMRTLEQEGVIATVNGRKKVPSFSFEDLQQIFELKVAIECDVIFLATNRQTVTQKKQMIQIREEIQNLNKQIKTNTKPASDYYPSWDTIDRQFHALLFEMANNDRARAIIDNLNMQWHRFRMGLMAMANRLETSLLEHHEMANLVILNKASEAKERMEQHIKNLYEDILISSNDLLIDGEGSSIPK